MKTVIFDIDGTLANITHRRAYVSKPKADWEAFNALMQHDTPNHAVVSLYKTLWTSREYEMVLITGRTDNYREVTETWLMEHDIPFTLLQMRRHLDFRPDHLIKEEMLHLLLSEGRQILFVVDDRQQVVDMWRRNGIVCLQCAEGNF